MGVHQLWKVLEPSARPVLLESLRGKTLAIDASIWIYHFLKAMRDSSGNAMRAGHIIGFFRRICKLLFYEIRPVFVFDGAAPAIKRITTDRRKHRAHKRREGAKATANRILTLQLQRLAKEQEEKSKSSARKAAKGARDPQVVGTVPENVSYYEDPQNNDASHSDPQGQDPQRPFVPQDQYDLPDLEKIQAVRLNDQRLLTDEELDEYARQFTSQARSTGFIDSETVDFTSFEFQNLPIESQYQLLNEARLKSRLRMGYTSSQLGQMFPSSMEFSKFQIERVSQRNFFTQKLMNLVGLDDDLATRRVNSEKGKEYMLQKQDGGYIMSLGTHGNATDVRKPGEAPKTKEDTAVSESEDEFEDIDLDPKPKPEPVTELEPQSPEQPKLQPRATEPAVKDSGQKPDLNQLFGWESQVQREQLYNSKRKLVALESEPLPEPEPEPKGVEDVLPSWFSDSAKRSFKMPETTLKMGLSSKPVSSLNLNSLFSGQSLFKRARKDEDQDQGQNRSQKSDTMGTNPTTDLFVKKPAEETTEPVDDHMITEKPAPEQVTLLTKEQATEPQAQTPVRMEVSDPQVSISISSHPHSQQDSTDGQKDEPEVLSAPTPEPFTIEKPVTLEDPEVQKEHEPLQEHAQQPSNEPSTEAQPEVQSETQPRAQPESTPFTEPTQEPEPVAVEPQVQSPLPTLEGPEKELAQQEAEYDEEEEQDIQNIMVQELEENERFAQTLSRGQKAANYAAEIERLKSVYHQEKRDADNVTDDMVRECMELLQLFGIPYVSAPGEAEAQCAELFELGLVDGIVTDDGDCFLFGNVCVYRNMFNQAKYVEAYESKVIQKELGLDRSKLISLAYLLGSDYTDGIVGVGPVTGVELLADFDGDLTRFRDWWNQAQRYPDEADTSTAFRKRFLKKFASKLFLPDNFPDELVSESYWRPNVDPDDTKFEWGRPEAKSISKFMCMTSGWDVETVNQLLMPVVEEQKRRAMLQKQSGKQSTLDEFAQINKQFRSKRAALATERLQQRSQKERAG